MRKKRRLKGNYTIEASIWISFCMLVMMVVLKMGIFLFQEIREREVSTNLKEIDALSEFYNYQVLKEVTEEFVDD